MNDGTHFSTWMWRCRTLEYCKGITFFRAKQLEGYEKTQVVNRVKERLVTIQNSSNYIVNAGVTMWGQIRG